MLCPSFEALTAATATAIGAFSVGLAAFALRSDRAAACLRSVPPIARCLVSGLLAGLGLLVMVPSALDVKPPSYPAAHLLLAFCTAPVAMYVVHHVVLEHQHAPGAPASACGPHMIQVQRRGPAALLTGGTLKFNATPTRCVSSGPPPPPAGEAERRRREACGGERQRAGDAAPALLEAGLTKEAREVFEGCAAVLLRAAPYALHASIDGAVLATATSLRMLASLALPITLCAVQDVGTLLVALIACRASHRAKLVVTGCFGLGFPLGASVALAVGARAAASSSADVALLRAFAGGLFLYMALFELAPPHAHDRRTHLRYALGFVGGLAVVVLSEYAEAALLARARQRHRQLALLPST